MNRKFLVEELNKLTEEQDMCSISIQYNHEKFINIELIAIIDDILVLYVLNEESKRLLAYDDLKYFLNTVNSEQFYYVKLVFEHPYNEVEVVGLKIDNSEFEGILGDKNHPYFTTIE